MWGCVCLVQNAHTLLLLLLTSGISTHLTETDYTGHSVIRAAVREAHQVQALQDFHSNTDGVEFWQEPSLSRDADIHVRPEAMESVSSFLEKSGIKHTIVTRDVQGLINDERQTVRSRARQGFNVTDYHTYEEIHDWLDNLSKTCGKICSVFDIGTTSEGRKQRVIRIGSRTNPRTPAVWIDAGIHAREWIAPATAIYLIDKLLDGHKAGDPIVRQLVRQYVWYILPVANPDGYSYTWTSDRLWRKTRSVHPKSDCRGADPNRNWNYYWGGRGTSGNPCRENYHGQFPFSEPETRSMANFLWMLRQPLLVYLSLHSYGQYWLTPWGFTYNVPDDFSEMMNQATEATNAMSRSNMTEYTVGSSARLLYLASGGSDDWAKGIVGVKYAYTVELGDTGQYGFLLPSQYIEPTGEDMFSAIRTLAQGTLRERRRLLSALRKRKL